ncbi:hypothetical protein ABEB36_014221 [Hypothenemus hampei]|uniref:Uncharacterized protein n=1 Tax=Hypothenemus hampei TaxID=57062 RepID=A0ABD1E3Z3_HYPHA
MFKQEYHFSIITAAPSSLSIEFKLSSSDVARYTETVGYNEQLVGVTYLRILIWDLKEPKPTNFGGFGFSYSPRITLYMYNVNSGDSGLGMGLSGYSDSHILEYL